MKRLSLQIALPLAIMVELAGLGATIYGYRQIKSGAREADAARFERLVEVQKEEITARLESYESVLYGGIGLLNGSEEVSAEEWRVYVDSIPLEKVAPGILGIGTIVTVSAEDRPRRLAELKKERGEFFEYKTVGGVEAPAGGSYVIDRIEPIERNLTALGLDIGSEQNRRQAFEKARDTGTPQVTGIIQLVQDDMKTPGFLLIIPRYKMGATVDTLEARREAFLDVVYAPMIGKDILTLPTSSSKREVAFKVYDEQERPERLIHSVTVPGWEGEALMEKIEVWSYAGREWLIHSWSTPNFVSKVGRGQDGFLYFGITLSTLLAAILFALHRSHSRTVRLMHSYYEQADEKTRINELFVENAPAAIAIFDTNLCFMAASRRWMKQFDLTGEIIGKHHYDVFPEVREIPEWRDAHKRGLAGESLSGGDDRFERANGKVQYLRWEIHPWHKAGGDIGGIIVFSLDVTEEVMNRERLEKVQHEVAIVEERLRQATKAGNVGVWDWHIAQDRLTWNQQMFDLFGVVPEQFSGCVDDFSNAVLEQDLPKVQQAMKKSLEKDIEYKVECRTKRMDQPSVLAVGKVYRDEDGNPERMLGVCVDVSSQVRMRTELKIAMENQAAARREAENMARAREQFLATMSHEIRTPMNGMIGMSEMLLETELNEAQREYAQTIVDCGESLLSLVNDILDVSRIEAGAVELENKAYDPAKLMMRVAQMCTAQAKQKGLSLEQDIAAGAPREVMGDRNRMQQVLLNLVSNALKFTSNGSIRCSLRRDVDALGREILVYEVADSGVGMTEDELEKVFAPFVQADASTTRKHGGSGLGLSISRSLTTLMGGSLELKSEPGVGTVAEVRVPMGNGNVHQKGRDIHVQSSGSQHEESAPIKRLLIVEDNPVNQRVTELQMRNFCLEIDVADDGRRAVEMFRDAHYDLILMDCQMPVMDGYEATQMIRKMETETGQDRVPIIALTANVMEHEQSRVIESGMDGFLSKPLKKEMLVRELKRIKLA